MGDGTCRCHTRCGPCPSDHRSHLKKLVMVFSHQLRFSVLTRLFMNTAENLGFKSVKLEFCGRYFAVVGCFRVKVHPLDLPALRLASIFPDTNF